jgi:hypothetical protein
MQFALGRSLAAAAAGDTGRSDVAAACAATPTATDEGRAFGRALVALAIRTVATVGDRSSRSASFTTGLRQAGFRVVAHAPAVVLTGDAESALVAFTHLRGRATGGIYLAPWLLDSTVLAATSQRGLPQLAVGSIGDPMAPLADRYRGVLAALAARVQPTEAGLLGFTSVAAQPSGTAALRIYAAAPVGFLPGVLDVGHQHGATGWFANGTLAPITTAQSVRTQCVTTS